MPGNLEIKEPASEGAPDRPQDAEMHTSNGLETGDPLLVHRNGVTYVEGCDIPVWRLEMARRAGSPPSALLKVTGGLTPEGLDLAFAYAEQHAEEMYAPIRELGLDDIPAEEEEDDEAEIRADLDEIFETYGEVFRRLAQ
jgi:uncharacterized protein (DUF433 family)